MKVATAIAWPRTLDRYGDEYTYKLAADWLRDCATVADWGGARGYFARFLPGACQYMLVDGTCQTTDQVVADLQNYHEPSDGILLRHVLDNTHEWRPILENALAAFRRRMVVVTYTPDAPVTTKIPHANGWPEWHFNPRDLRGAMEPHLICETAIRTSHPEHVYYLERA